MIRDIVQQCLHGDLLNAYIQAQVEKCVPECHWEKFTSDLHTDLANLAPFSIAGMGLSVRELEVWQQGKY